MKNEIIVALVSKGVGRTTALTLDSSDAYRHYKFKKWLDKMYSTIVESERDMLKEVGIDDINSFTQRLAELNAKEDRTEEENREFEAKKLTDSLAGSRLEAILNEDIENCPCDKISYESFHKLMKENECLASADIEYQLEGVLWEEKEDE